MRRHFKEFRLDMEVAVWGLVTIFWQDDYRF